ncbi:GIY-YIG nuclease family protein [Streptomyces griseofuscus]|uniref:Bacteriophage T5 Orf172 DNA-binding domain-containing protein n=1 Tax=Streptomyces griseofuscus TaxID=146922 RepID=A0A426RYZ4_9ACTN|nr:GIY-YIG nuclease family protein [Streptomyces griseofuscus]RRQ81548.1 hypothetical protein CQW44_30575 [Streptomyces griseofuscus]
MAHGNYFTPKAIKDARCGMRRSIAQLISLVDTEDPAFQRVADVLQDMASADVELTEDVVGIAVKMGRHKHAEEQAKRRNTPARMSIVYYIRRGDLIKIGTTTNPASRLRSLMPDVILAFEPGDVELETIRHQQFRASRVARKSEYFHQTEGLAAHIAAIRQQHGDPDPAWPSVATLGTGYVRSKVKVDLPEPTSSEMATATDGARLLQMSKATVHGWAHRGLINSVGRDERGRPLYYVDHMRFLIERNRAWHNHKKHRKNDAS